MRLSSDSNDHSFNEWYALNDTYIARVYLNDVEQKMCVTADEEEGFIVRVATDESGRTIVDDGQVRHERLDGVVRIELMPRS